MLTAGERRGAALESLTECAQGRSLSNPMILLLLRLQLLEVSLSAAAFVLAACEASEERREPRAPRVLHNGSSALGAGIELTVIFG